MKILFFIFAKGHGSGGHFHSLNHISQAIGEKLEVGIFTVGTGNSVVLEKNPYFIKHIYFNGLNFFSFRKVVNKEISSFNPEIVHCFDSDVFNVLKLSSNSNKYRFVVNKCGGQNSKDFPKVENLVLFSIENKHWFEENKKFKNTPLYLIPNRVNKDDLLDYKARVNISQHQDIFYFIRIARIGSRYKKSIEGSISLIDSLIKDGISNIHLYIVGAVQSDTILNDLNNLAKQLPVEFLIEDKYTKKASDLLYLADAVIATGRGIMEAAALGKPMLTPAENSKLPILVDQSNFMSFFSTNFSQRNLADENSLNNNLNNIHKLITDETYYNTLSKYAEDTFLENFEVKKGVEKYIEVYRNAVKTKKLSKFIDIIPKMRTLYSLLIK